MELHNGIFETLHNVQHFNFQLMHTTLKKRRVIKTF